MYAILIFNVDTIGALVIVTISCMIVHSMLLTSLKSRVASLCSSRACVM